MREYELIELGECKAIELWNMGKVIHTGIGE